MMYYIERDNEGAIVALYANPQDGRTETDPLPETDPEVAAFLAPPQTLEDYRSAIQAHVDATARARNYDNAVSCASYVASGNAVWVSEAQAFVIWRDTVWGYAIAELAKVHNGQRPQPSIDDFIAELPSFSWPNG
ncbi:hypothetical protein [Chelatococcus sp. XZ-Ab1]|uniref:hypothetical protein n=1 Tax=Chelatococcus sp. XZ-Ab1 TaxID=3034027 RepID=UPI0023E3834D|nr:hypothetical protein [Chelatococcus sp. XZ-Ab1]